MWFAVEMVSNHYYCGVHIWLTFSTKMSFSTYNYQLFWFIIEKKIPSCKKQFVTTLVAFNYVF
jgi:hypothetical protein